MKTSFGKTFFTLCIYIHHVLNAFLMLIHKLCLLLNIKRRLSNTQNTIAYFSVKQIMAHQYLLFKSYRCSASKYSVTQITQHFDGIFLLSSALRTRLKLSENQLVQNPNKLTLQYTNRQIVNWIRKSKNLSFYN